MGCPERLLTLMGKQNEGRMIPYMAAYQFIVILVAQKNLSSVAVVSKTKPKNGLLRYTIAVICLVCPKLLRSMCTHQVRYDAPAAQ